jgi:diguanylate cyclase (GGDEF)-like protein
VERARNAREIAYLAHHDPLTGLSNRGCFLEALTRAAARVRRGPLGLGVFFVDLDRFKAINDQQGHAAGDRVLRAAAQSMRDCLRGSDSVARIGGDEFAALVEDVATPSSMAVIAAKLGRALAALPEDSQQRCSASIGAVFVPPGSAVVPGVVLAAADTAMYRAKRKGGNSYEVCVHEPTQPTSDSSRHPHRRRLGSERAQERRLSSDA